MYNGSIQISIKSNFTIPGACAAWRTSMLAAFLKQASDKDILSKYWQIVDKNTRQQENTGKFLHH
jgi:hypothetical protein